MPKVPEDAIISKSEIKKVMQEASITKIPPAIGKPVFLDGIPLRSLLQYGQ